MAKSRKRSPATKAQPRSRITAAHNLAVSSSPGLQDYAASTVRPSESSNRFGQRYKASAQELVNGFTKYVAVAQSRNANAVASCPLRLYRQVRGGRKTSWDIRPVKRKELLRQRSRSGAWTRKAAEMADEVEEIVDPLHPVLAVLNRPNLLLSGFGLIEQIQMGVGLAGDNYLHPVAGPDGYPVEAWLLPPQFVIPIPNRDTIIGGYIYGRGTEVEKEYPASDVIRFTQPNPKGDPFRGFGDLEKCILDAELSIRFSQIRLQMIDNGAQPGLVLVAKGATEQQRARIEALVNRKFSGAQNQGRTMVLSGDVTVNPWSMTEKEVKFLDSDPQVRETIANCHDMSSALLTLDSAALATAEAAIPQWQEQAIKPRCNRIADTLNIRFLPMFGQLSGAETLYLCFDEAVEKDAAADGALAVSMYAGDIITKNEARELADYDSVPDGDQFKSEVSQANAMETLAATPAPVANDPNQDPKANDSAPATEGKVLRDEDGDHPPRVEAALASKSLFRGPSCTCCSTHGKSMQIPSSDELEALLRGWFAGIAPTYVEQIGENGLKKSVVSTLSRTLGQTIDAPLARVYLEGWNNGVHELGSNAGDAKVAYSVLTPARTVVTINQPDAPPTPPGIAIELTPTPDPTILPPAPTTTPTGTLTTPVEKYLREYKGKTIRSVTETVDKRIRQELADGIAKGESIPELTTRVQSTVADMGRVSAERIARTETARAFNAAKEKSWLESGLVWGKRILLSPDACPLCKQIAKIYGTMALGVPFLNKGDKIPLDDGTEVEIDYADLEEPPIHPNCVLGDTDVLPGSIVAATRAMYRGNIVTIRTRNGRILSCTENHNVLTRRGFVPASAIDEGDYLVCGLLASGSAMAPNSDDRPSAIENVFESLSRSASVTTYSVPPSPIQFHGDGRSFVGKINVVAPNGLLWDGVDTGFLKKICERSLGRTVADDEPLSGRRNLDAMLLSLRFAAYGRVTEGRNAASLLGAGVGHPEVHRLAAISLGDPLLTEPENNDTSGNSESVGECLDALSGVVETDEVVDIEFSAFHGFVYDLSTVSGAYVSNGIISHNCRCSMVMVMEEPKQ